MTMFFPHDILYQNTYRSNRILNWIVREGSLQMLKNPPALKACNNNWQNLCVVNKIRMLSLLTGSTANSEKENAFDGQDIYGIVLSEGHFVFFLSGNIMELIVNVSIDSEVVVEE